MKIQFNKHLQRISLSILLIIFSYVSAFATNPNLEELKNKQELVAKIKKEVSEKIEILRKHFLGNLTVGDASQLVISHKKKQDSMHCLQVNLH